MTKWKLLHEQANIDLMSDTLKISKTMAQVMVNRNIRTKNTALAFLNPRLALFHDIYLMKDVDRAIKIIIETVSNGGKIAIYGDYDVDGVMSTVILYKTLKKYGADVLYYIPDREIEGYGLNMEAVRTLNSEGIDLIVTCDNGIASIAEINEAKSLGMKVIVIDHHEPGFVIDENLGKIDVLPNADSIVDPKQSDCNYPFKMLCAAGICFKFAKAFHECADMDFDFENEFFVLAMFATYCDIVDLHGENRIIVKNGLQIINNDKNINKGINAMLFAKSYYDKEINGYAVGFVLGPCINASGRLDRATEAVSLLTSENYAECEIIAKKLAELNEERKAMTLFHYEEAVMLVEKTNLKEHKVLVMVLPTAHESIAGIVAGRLKEHFHKPVIVLTKSGDFIKGSARSIEGYNIFEAMYSCKHLFERFGGHAMAAGVTLIAENVPVLRKYLNENCNLTEDDFVEILKYDKELEISDVTFELAQELTHLAPFGKANKEPMFVTRNLIPEQLQVYKEKKVLIFRFINKNSQRKVKALSFGHIDKFENELTKFYNKSEIEKIMCGILRNNNFTIDIIYSIEINEYNGDKSVQMKIKDFVIKRGLETYSKEEKCGS